MGRIEEGGERGNSPIPHLDQVENVGVTHLPAFGAEFPAPMHDGPRRIDDPAVHMHLEHLESIELAGERHGLLGAVLGGGPAIGSKAAVFRKASGSSIRIVTTAGLIA